VVAGLGSFGDKCTTWNPITYLKFENPLKLRVVGYLFTITIIVLQESSSWFLCTHPDKKIHRLQFGKLFKGNCNIKCTKRNKCL